MLHLPSSHSVNGEEERSGVTLDTEHVILVLSCAFEEWEELGSLAAFSGAGG